MDRLKEMTVELMGNQHFDSLALGVVDFKKKDFQSFQFVSGSFIETPVWFDLASITKPFTIGLKWLMERDALGEEWILCSEHRAGLPEWARLDRKTWRQQVLSYPINPGAQTVYSCLSPLRAMCMTSDDGDDFYLQFRDIWDSEILHWSEIKDISRVRPTGYRHGNLILGEVHDPNAFNLKQKIANAGLFGTVEGACRTLLKMQEKFNFIKVVSQGKIKEKSKRFYRSFDFVTTPESSLAGEGCTTNTFGHLGFTGTCFWIHPELNRGFVLLTNGTQNYWYDRGGLNLIRKQLGQAIWKA